jgi:sugar lactone lactonase YvrE
MKQSLMNAIAAMIILSLPLSSFGAETVKLRSIVSVYFDSKAGSIKLPEGVACSEKSVFIVADTGNNRLLRYTFQEGVVKGGEEIKVPELPYPIRVQLNSAGEIFALDGKLRRIARLNPDGTFKSYIDPEGLPSATTVVPKSFRIDNKDNIYILDIYSDRILVLDPAGKYLKHIELPKDYGFISDFAVGPTGTVYLLDSVKTMVYSSSQESKDFSPLTVSMKEDMNFPATITVDKSGAIYLADLMGSAITILGQDGSFRGHQSGFGWKEGLVRYPSQLCINEKEEIFVADRENSRVQIFTLVR